MEREPRPGRRLLLLAALAGAFTVALAGAPTASAGIPFDQLPKDEATLTVNLTGAGGGFVASDDERVTCTRANNVNTPSPCSVEYSWIWVFKGPTPTLSATAAAGSNFTGWTVNPANAIVSGCGTQSQCEVNLDVSGTGDDVTVTANFVAAPNLFPLTVTKAGNGTGTVTSAPAGIDCGSDCGESYAQGTVVTLTAAAGPASTFAGWSGGGCSGTGACVVTVTAATTVTATFDAQTFPLTVSLAGPPNSGAVSSTPEGIACPQTCTFNYISGTTVSLTATAAPGYVFQGWSGPVNCPGTGPCAGPVAQALNITATFARAAVNANVVNTRIRYTGPRIAVRQLQVTVNAREDLRRIVLRIRRGGVTLQSRTIRNFEADRAVLRMNIRNGIAAGRAQLQVTFVNEAGTQEVQTRGIRIPPR